jgi:hypothetical protein
MPVESLNQYVARVSTEAEVPGGYKFIEYRNERYGVLPKRGCNDCHSSGLITRNGEESKCDCLWRRMFDARRLRPAAGHSPAFISNSPGMVDELKKRRGVLQKQLDAARADVTGTQTNMDDELKRHDAVVEQAAQTVEQLDEAHRLVQADIEHLDKSIEYNKGRADELRTQARELENQNERDKITLNKRRSHDLHQAALERDRARKKIEKLAEERGKISHRWHKQLRDPQRDLRKAEERLARVDKQIEQLDVVDLAEPLPPPPAPPSINPMTARSLTVPASPLTAAVPPVAVTSPPAESVPEVNRNPATGAALIDSLAAMLPADPVTPRPADEIQSPTPPAPATVVVPAEVALAALRASLGIPDDFATGPTTAVETLRRAETAKSVAAQDALREVAQEVADTVAEAHGLPPVTVTVPKPE